MDFCDKNPKVVKWKGVYFYDKSFVPLTGELLTRASKMPIPPVYNSFWIARNPKDKIQAVWEDSLSRKQYYYHPEHIAQSNANKFNRMEKFAKKLPCFWKQVEKELPKTIAYMFLIIKETNIRVGNKKYLEKHESQGLTTLKPENVRFKKNIAYLHFTGKSGIEHSLEIHNPMVVTFLKKCVKKNKEWLFIDEGGRRIDSNDLNIFLRKTIGAEFTCKDFRTHAANSLFKKVIGKMEGTPKQKVSKALAEVAKALGHNKSTSKKSYVSPELVERYEK